MKATHLAHRGLAHYWRTNLAVVVGVATAVAVLTGALLVGDSVRGSLRDLVLLRIGNTDHVVVSTGFVREALAEAVAAHPEFGQAFFENTVPLVAIEGAVTTQIGGNRASGVRVYGVDDRFWAFHSVEGVEGPSDRGAYLSPALAAELETADGDTILVRVQQPRDVPIESVYGQKDDLGQTVRATVVRTLEPSDLGEFSLAAQQGEVLAVFLPLRLIQDELETPGRVNALLVSGGGEADASGRLESIVADVAEIDDLGLRVRVGDRGNAVILEADDGLLDTAVVDAALSASLDLNVPPQRLFTYLANDIRIGDRTIPYSLVTGVEYADIGMGGIEDSDPPPVLLNQWAADDLDAAIGDRVTLEYYFWQDPGILVTREMDFQLAAIVPDSTGDVDMAPDYPGISESDSLTDWDPPFPIDLTRIRDQDEAYWDEYSTTPKAFVGFAAGQRLWQSRYGSMTSIRLVPGTDDAGTDALANQFRTALAAHVDPLAAGLTVAPTRSDGLESAEGAVNFGEYFIYFSFFLVVSALMLAALFFKLSIEQRVREVGLLGAIGFTPADVRRVFMREGLWLSIAGTAFGIAGGVGYGYLIVAALGTWWVGAVGTRALTLHIAPLSVAIGSAGGLVAALVCIRFTLGQLARLSERSLLAGRISDPGLAPSDRQTRLWAGGAFAVIGITLAGLGAGGVIPDAGGFFGAGAALLAAALAFVLHRFSRPVRSVIGGIGWGPVSRLGLRSVTYRPSRSVVATGMIAAATFILISLDAFRIESVDDAGPNSSTGGYRVLVESLLPVAVDPNSAGGLEALGLDGFDRVNVAGFRYRPGDDASCLNLYTPQNPRIIAPTNDFIDEGRFAFSQSLATTDSERENPWQLLRGRFDDGAIPVIADSHSITYVLHTALGEDIVVTDRGREIRLRVVAALSDSLFQGEILMSEANFTELFPDLEGFSYLLVESDQTSVSEMVSAIEFALEDAGATVTPTLERMARYHQVQNTYLSTFQALGGLGLLLGTVGLGAILMRNVLERRKELALLRALGFRRTHFFLMVISENVLLLTSGLAIGSTAALVAIAPAIGERGGQLPGIFLLVLLGGVLGAGLITSVIATIAALRSPLLSALRTE